MWLTHLNAENNRGVNDNVAFAYAHEKMNILLSVLSIFSFYYNDFNLNTNSFTYTERKKKRKTKFIKVYFMKNSVLIKTVDFILFQIHF